MDGIIIINKPKNYTSNDIVNKVKRLLNTKVGHTGTLDPNATGVLPLLLGKGTKFSKYLINHDKKYIATLKLGIKTTTADCEGDVIEELNVDKSIFIDSKIEETLKTFVGKQIQTPPIYSAIKVNGKKLYEYARNNMAVEVPKREIEIYKINLVDKNENENIIVFEVECSKGTYIRSLCEDIANALGTVGYMKDLQRARVGAFNIEDAVTLEELEQNKDNLDWIYKNIISLEKLLSKSPKITIEEKNVEKFYNGVKLNAIMEDGVYAVYYNNSFIGSAEIKNNTIKRDILIKDL